MAMLHQPFLANQASNRHFPAGYANSATMPYFRSEKL
jgi:hypothetical protein